MSEKTIRQLLEELHGDVGDIKVVLKGYNGQEGLCQKVDNHGKAINKLWIAVVIILASTGGGSYILARLIIGG